MKNMQEFEADLHTLVREQKRDEARRAFAAGKGRDDHGMNHGSAAIADWQAEWDRCAQESRRAAC